MTQKNVDGWASKQKWIYLILNTIQVDIAVFQVQWYFKHMHCRLLNIHALQLPNLLLAKMQLCLRIVVYQRSIHAHTDAREKYFAIHTQRTTHCALCFIQLIDSALISRKFVNIRSDSADALTATAAIITIINLDINFLILSFCGIPMPFSYFKILCKSTIFHRFGQKNIIKPHSNIYVLRYIMKAIPPQWVISLIPDTSAARLFTPIWHSATNIVSLHYGRTRKTKNRGRHRKDAENGLRP